jgi:hypothetical protein
MQVQVIKIPFVPILNNLNHISIPDSDTADSPGTTSQDIDRRNIGTHPSDTQKNQQDTDNANQFLHVGVGPSLGPLRRRVRTLIPNSNNLIPAAAHLAARSNADLGCVSHGMNIWQNHCLHIDDSNSGFDHPLAGPRDGRRQFLVLGGEKPALENSRKKIVIIKRHTKRPNDPSPPRGSTMSRAWLMESFEGDLCKKAHRGHHSQAPLNRQ